jgi:MFS family permease
MLLSLDLPFTSFHGQKSSVSTLGPRPGLFRILISLTDLEALFGYEISCLHIELICEIPMYMKFGRRLVMISTLVVFVAGLAGCSGSHTYPQLMALRVLQSFGSGVCEALPVQVVNEIVVLCLWIY